MSIEMYAQYLQLEQKAIWTSTGNSKTHYSDFEIWEERKSYNYDDDNYKFVNKRTAENSYQNKNQFKSVYISLYHKKITTSK